MKPIKDIFVRKGIYQEPQDVITSPPFCYEGYGIKYSANSKSYAFGLLQILEGNLAGIYWEMPNGNIVRDDEYPSSVSMPGDDEIKIENVAASSSDDEKPYTQLSSASKAALLQFIEKRVPHAAMAAQSSSATAAADAPTLREGRVIAARMALSNLFDMIQTNESDEKTNCAAQAVQIEMHNETARKILSNILLEAAAKDLTETCITLLSKGVDACHKDAELSPLIWAARNCNPRLCKALLEHGATRIIEDRFMGDTPLLLALQSENVTPRNETCAILLKYGAQVDAMNKEMTGLYAATLSEDIDKVSLLLRAGADPLAECRGGDTPLALASRKAAADNAARHCYALVSARGRAVEKYPASNCCEILEEISKFAPKPQLAVVAEPQLAEEVAAARPSASPKTQGMISRVVEVLKKCCGRKEHKD